MYLLKELYSRAFYNQIGEVFASIVPGFDKKAFIKKIYAPGFEAKELKERMRHTSVVLHSFLPANFAKAAKLLKKAIIQFRKLNVGEDRLEYMFLPDYIETYGIDDYAISVEALEFTTQFVSCE